MAHDTEGTYRATLDATLELVNGKMYEVIVLATGSNGEQGEFRDMASAKLHT